MKKLWGFVAVVSLSTLLCALAQDGGGRITLEDLLSVEAPGAPTLSPDGRTFAMVRSGQIVLMPSEGGWPLTLTSTNGGKSDLSWSPDSRSIAFTSQGSVWAVAAVGGPPRRLTNAPAGSGDPRTAADRAPLWSPQGHWILFQTGRRGNNDLMVVSDDGAVSSFITTSPADEGSPAWAPDGTHVSYTERTPESFSGKLKVLTFDPATGRSAGTAVELHAAPEDRGGGWFIPAAEWSPDGKQLAVVLQHSGWDNVYLIPAAGGPPRPLTQGESEDEGPVFSPDGKSLAITSNRKNLEERNVWIVPLDGTAPRQLAQSATPGVERAPRWSPDGSKIFFLRSTPLEPANLMVAATSGSAVPKYLTQTLPKNFERAKFKVAEEVHFTSKDGHDVAGILYKPRDFKAGTRYPAVLWIHGGPEGQDALDWDPWAHYLTQEGYLVLEPNYRGSRGYGEKWRNLNVEDNGGGEVDDVAAGAEYLVAQGMADPKRLAIGGGSHGGTMTAYMVTKRPELFAVALELFGVTDRATFVERTNRPSAIRWMMKMGGNPQEKPEGYKKANILLDVARMKTPVMILHGEQDPQVPPYESTQFVRELKKYNKVYYYFTYPGEGHGFTQRDHRLDAWKKQLAFLARYLKPVYGQSITSTDDIVLGKP